MAAPSLEETIARRVHGHWLTWLVGQQVFWVSVAAVAAFVVLALASDVFATQQNLFNVTRNFAFVAIIAIGMTAFVLMIPLAFTSTNKMVKRLGGKAWSLLHRIVYLAGVAGVLHYWMLVKSDTRLPLTFAFVLAVLLGFRVLMRFAPSRPAESASLFPPK